MFWIAIWVVVALVALLLGMGGFFVASELWHFFKEDKKKSAADRTWATL